MFPIDIEQREREARDDMIRRGKIPLAEPTTMAALKAAGVTCFGLDTSVRAELPRGWRAEADPLDHRRWYLLDATGTQRFVCFWKDAGYEPARGSVAAVEDDGLVRQWKGHDSEHFHQTGTLQLTITCPCGGHRAGIQIDGRLAEERPAWARDIVSRAEAQIRAEAAALGCVERGVRARRGPW